MQFPNFDILLQLADIEETIQNMKEDISSEHTKDDERSKEIKERWRKQLKEGIKREDIKCSTCGRVRIRFLGNLHKIWIWFFFNQSFVLCNDALFFQDGFKMICHYERHEKSHDEEKPFVCHLCNKTFKYVGSVKYWNYSV